MNVEISRKKREQGWYINRRGKLKKRSIPELEAVRIRRADKKWRQRERRRQEKNKPPPGFEEQGAHSSAQPRDQ